MPSEFRNHRSVSILFQEFVTNRNAAGLYWLRQLLDKDAELIDSASAESAAVFRDRVVEGLRANLKDEAENVLAEIAQILNIEVAEPKVEGQEIGFKKSVDEVEGLDDQNSNNGDSNQ